MNLLGKVFDLLSSPRTAPKPPDSASSPVPSPLSTRTTNRVQKPKRLNARQQATRRQRLSQAALRELNNGVITPSRRRFETKGGNWDGEVDDVLEDDAVWDAQKEAQVETSQADGHEIEIEPEEVSASAPVTNEDAPEPVKQEETTEEEDTPMKEEAPDQEDDDTPEPASCATAMYTPMKEEEAPSSEDEEEQWFLTSLSGHRWVDSEIQVQVNWHGWDATWEPERNIHLDAPDVLFKYWDAQGGRPMNPEDPDMFDIVAIQKHRRRMLLVEWTGYRPESATWVARKSVEKTAPEVVEEYFEGLKSKKKK